MLIIIKFSHYNILTLPLVLKTRAAPDKGGSISEKKY